MIALGNCPGEVNSLVLFFKLLIDQKKICTEKLDKTYNFPLLFWSYCFGTVLLMLWDTDWKLKALSVWMLSASEWPLPRSESWEYTGKWKCKRDRTAWLLLIRIREVGNLHAVLMFITSLFIWFTLTFSVCFWGIALKIKFPFYLGFS